MKSLQVSVSAAHTNGFLAMVLIDHYNAFRK